jgi:hypothetical protein
MEVFYDDSSIANNMEFVFGTQTDGSTGVGVIGSLATSGSAGVGSGTDALDYTVSNGAHHYFVTVRGDPAWDADLLLHRVVIRYGLP